MALSIFIRIGPVVPPDMDDPLPDGIGPAHAPDRFLTEYEHRFEKEYGFFRPITKEVVERYLDC